ncbi:MAG: metallophosphoesterase [Chloroflexi bacterium]|nr:metallophosphoesterase [Chloroflexota bacterium]
MKLVLFSDLHLDAQFAWLGADQQRARRRRQAQRDTLRNIVSLTARVQADALLCGGDLYEQERFTPDTAAFLRSTFAELAPTSVFLAPGNHDWYGPTSLYRQVDWSPNVHVFREARLEPVALTDGLTLWGAAHAAPANTPGFLDSFRTDRGGINLALFHGSERTWLGEQDEGKQPHAPFWPRQVEEAGLDHALLGHFHRPRDAERYTYPGNPDPLTFGEDGPRGAVVVAVLPDGTVRRERHHVGVTEAHDLPLDLTGCSSAQEVRDRLARLLASREGVARVTLQGELNSAVDLNAGDLERGHGSLDALKVRIGSLYVGYDFDRLAEEPTVRGQFVRDVRAASLTEDERRKVLVTGLRALDGRADLEAL